MIGNVLEAENMVPAIVVFAFNRPIHLQRLFESLQGAKGADKLPLYIYVDGPRNLQDTKKIEETIEIIEKYRPHFTVMKVSTRIHNIGLSLSVVTGISEVTAAHDGVIVLEDDMQVSPKFIEFMLVNLSRYQYSYNIGSITGYKFAKGPFWQRGRNFISLRHSSWAWGTWQDRWEKIDWTILKEDSDNFRILQKKMYRIGEDLPRMMELARLQSIDSWSIVFDANAAKFSWKCLHPAYSLAINNGFDGSGTHSSSRISNNHLSKSHPWNYPPDICEYSAYESKLYNAEVWFRNSRFSRFYLIPFFAMAKVFRMSWKR